MFYIVTIIVLFAEGRALTTVVTETMGTTPLITEADSTIFLSSTQTSMEESAPTAGGPSLSLQLSVTATPEFQSAVSDSTDITTSSSFSSLSIAYLMSDTVMMISSYGLYSVIESRIDPTVSNYSLDSALSSTIGFVDSVSVKSEAFMMSSSDKFPSVTEGPSTLSVSSDSVDRALTIFDYESSMSVTSEKAMTTSNGVLSVSTDIYGSVTVFPDNTAMPSLEVESIVSLRSENVMTISSYGVSVVNTADTIKPTLSTIINNDENVNTANFSLSDTAATVISTSRIENQRTVSEKVETTSVGTTDAEGRALTTVVTETMGTTPLITEADSTIFLSSTQTSMEESAPTAGGPSLSLQLSVTATPEFQSAVSDSTDITTSSSFSSLSIAYLMSDTVMMTSSYGLYLVTESRIDPIVSNYSLDGALSSTIGFVDSVSVKSEAFMMSSSGKFPSVTEGPSTLSVSSDSVDRALTIFDHESSMSVTSEKAMTTSNGVLSVSTDIYGSVTVFPDNTAMPSLEVESTVSLRSENVMTISSYGLSVVNTADTIRPSLSIIINNDENVNTAILSLSDTAATVISISRIENQRTVSDKVETTTDTEGHALTTVVTETMGTTPFITEADSTILSMSTDIYSSVTDFPDNRAMPSLEAESTVSLRSEHIMTISSYGLSVVNTAVTIRPSLSIIINNDENVNTANFSLSDTAATVISTSRIENQRTASEKVETTSVGTTDVVTPTQSIGVTTKETSDIIVITTTSSTQSTLTSSTQATTTSSTQTTTPQTITQSNSRSTEVNYWTTELTAAATDGLQITTCFDIVCDGAGCLENNTAATNPKTCTTTGHCLFEKTINGSHIKERAACKATGCEDMDHFPAGTEVRTRCCDTNRCNNNAMDIEKLDLSRNVAWTLTPRNGLFTIVVVGLLILFVPPTKL